MSKRVVQCVFRGELIKQPVMYLACRKHDLILNIRRAKITAELGEATIELDGSEKNIDAAIKDMTEGGVEIQTVSGDLAV